MADLNDEELRRIELMHEMLTSEESDNKNGEVIIPTEEIIHQRLLNYKKMKNKMAYELVDSLEEQLEKALELNERINDELKKFEIGNHFVITDSNALGIILNSEYTRYSYVISAIDDKQITFFNPSLGQYKVTKEKIIDKKECFIPYISNCSHIVYNRGSDEYCLSYLYISGKFTIVNFHKINKTRKTYSLYPCPERYLSFQGCSNISFLTLNEYNEFIKDYTLETPYDQFYKNETFVKNREVFEAILNDLYPDLWFYRESYNTNVQVGVITPEVSLITYYIQFPKIELKNSSGHKHTIYDLMIVFYVKSEFRTSHTKPYGFRTTLSLDEIEVGYIHSHLPASRNNNFVTYVNPNIFCIGDGQPISIPCVKLNRVFDEDAWLSVLMQLPTFLSWESLEGVPHIHMKNIGKKEGNYHDLRFNPNGAYNLNMIDIDTRTKHKLYDVNTLKQFKYVVVKNKITNLDEISVLPESIVEVDKTLNLLTKVYYNDGIFYNKDRGSTSRYNEHTNRTLSSFDSVKADGKAALSPLVDELKKLKNSKHEPAEFYFKITRDGEEKDYAEVPNPFEVVAIQAHINNIIN